MQRRTALSVIGGSIGTITTGAYLYSDHATAVDVSVKSLSVPDATKSQSQSVSNIVLSISGEFSLDTPATPSKVVARVQVKQTNASEYSQLAATDWRSNLTGSTTKQFNLNGSLLSTLGGIGQSDVNPAEGSSVSYSFDVRVVIEVYSDGSKLGSATATDTYTLTIEHTKPGVSIGITADGSTNVTTATS